MMTRRELLKLAAVGGAAACTSSHDGVPAPDAPPVDPDAAAEVPQRDLDGLAASAQFALGVMAGDALADRALLWTRYDGARPLVVHVQDAASGRAVLEREVTVEPGGYVHVDATGLAPGGRYRYAFIERDGGRSAIGRFRAALADDALEPVTFAGVSCTSQFRDTTSANLGRLARRDDLDFVLHAGDQLYADFPADDPALDLAGYRAKYAFAWSRPGLGALHAAAGMYNTWDDHEIYDNWQGYRDVARIAAGVQTFFEHQPVRHVDRRLWRSVRWGRTLELFVLDCRSERDAATGRYLSDEQLAWLVAGLRASPAVFKLVLNSCPIGLFPANIDSWRNPADRWAAAPGQRAAVLDAANAAGGVWFLSGDFHFGTIGHVGYPSTDAYPRVREVLMGAGGQGLGSSAAVPGATRVAAIHALDDNAHWTFATPANNYVVFRAHPKADADHATPWLDIAFYDATTQLYTGQYRLL